MEINFNTQLLADLYLGNKVKDKEFKSNPILIKQFVKTVNLLKDLESITKIKQYNGLRYEKLLGDRKDTSSVRVNDQYRIIFLEIASETEPFEIEILEIEELSKHYE
jgi:toxin HigB-1